MSPSSTQLARARYVRTVLAWHGVSQSDLARLFGCAQQAVSKKLNGQRRFTDDELLLIADTFGLDPGNLLRPPELEPVLGAVRPEGTDITNMSVLITALVRGHSRALMGAASPLEGVAEIAA